MTPATETVEERSADTEIPPIEDALLTNAEMRLARRRGVIEGILQRCAFTAEQIALSEIQIAELVAADTETEPEKARALAAAISTESGADHPVAGDLVVELRALDEPFPGAESATGIDLASGPDVVVETTVQVDAGGTVTVVESHEVPIHRAICMAEGCKCGATYRPTASGAGIMVLERYGMDIETVLGVGTTGHPLCPRGHGEMTLADDQLPIEQAINQVNARTDAAKPRPLPFPAQPFNYEGVFHEIVNKRHEVAELERKHEDRKAAAKKAKDDLDAANEALGEMIEQFEQREQERKFEIERRVRQAEEGHPEGTTLVRCAWEQVHADDPCPLCTGKRADVEKVLGREIAARDASAHVDQVVIYRTRVDVADTEDALAGVVDRVHPSVIAEWTPEERAQVKVWAFATVDHEKGGTVAPPDRPAVLGTSHVAAQNVDGAQAKVVACKACGAVLQQLNEGDTPYAPGTLVGTDCPGAELEPSHHYPVRSKKKPTRARAPKPPEEKTKAAPKKRGLRK